MAEQDLEESFVRNKLHKVVKLQVLLWVVNFKFFFSRNLNVVLAVGTLRILLE